MNDVEEHQFPRNCTKSYLKRWARFFSIETSVLQPHTVLNQKITGLLIVLNCEAASLTVFISMCSKKQQTSDDLIVKDNCCVIEIFEIFSFSGILRGCLSHLNEAQKEQILPDNWYCEIYYNSWQ